MVAETASCAEELRGHAPATVRQAEHVPGCWRIGCSRESSDLALCGFASRIVTGSDEVRCSRTPALIDRGSEPSSIDEICAAKIALPCFRFTAVGLSPQPAWWRGLPTIS